MDDFISREATIKLIKEVYCVVCYSYHGVRCRSCGTSYAIDMIEDAPAADVALVRHGRWERTADGAALCTACKRKMNPSQYGYAFCSLCGAKMDGGNE